MVILWLCISPHQRPPVFYTNAHSVISWMILLIPWLLVPKPLMPTLVKRLCIRSIFVAITTTILLVASSATVLLLEVSSLVGSTTTIHVASVRWPSTVHSLTPVVHVPSISTPMRRSTVRSHSSTSAIVASGRISSSVRRRWWQEAMWRAVITTTTMCRHSSVVSTVLESTPTPRAWTATPTELVLWPPASSHWLFRSHGSLVGFLLRWQSTLTFFFVLL